MTTDERRPDAAAVDEVVGRLCEQNAKIAVAESCTGGLVATSIAATDGAGDCFLGGVVAYDRDVKANLLDVNVDAGVITRHAAEAMALGVRRLLGADIGVSTTGVVGPDSQEGQPVGTVWIGIATGDDVVAHRVDIGEREPEAVRNAATAAA